MEWVSYYALTQPGSTGPVIRMMVSSISWPEQLYIRHICCL